MDIQTAKKILEASATVGDAVLMEGPHGIGKSNIAEEFANDNGYHLEILFLSHQDVGDLIGIPHMIEKDGVQITTWSMPVWLQRMHAAAALGKRCVLFLDELNRAPIDVRQTSLQLVLEGRVHEHELPVVGGQRTFICSAINPADDYQVDELDLALLDRFLKIDVEADLGAWLKWAKIKKVNSVVQDFLREFPDRLHCLEASPRSWAKLAQFIDIKDQIADDIMLQICKGKLGEEIGTQFYVFLENYINVVKLEDVVKIVDDNKNKINKIEDLAEKISELMSKSEAIQKAEMASQLTDKFINTKNMLPLLAYMYSLEMEICTSFLKGLKVDNPDQYKKLAAYDTELNDKQLFRRIIQSSKRL